MPYTKEQVSELCGRTAGWYTADEAVDIVKHTPITLPEANAERKSQSRTLVDLSSVDAASGTQDLQYVKHDRKKEQKCIKCRQWWPIETHFGVHNTSSTGRQSICKVCKKEANKRAQNKNVHVRLRHHIATRCLDQLKGYVPSGFTRNIEEYLGYRISALVKHLREDLVRREGEGRSLKDALNEGYHVDHIMPLSSYKVIVDEDVDWETFKRCWRITNLSAIPSQENLAKGAKILVENDEH